MNIGLGGLLFVLFLTLKLTHYIGWSWWWVTCPLWGGLAVFVGDLLIVALVDGLFAIIAKAFDR